MVVLKKSNRLTKLFRKKLVISFALGVVWSSLLVVMLTMDPLLIVMRWYTRVTNGSFVHQYLKKEVEVLQLSAYAFNITNAERFLTGEDVQLKVEEIGPFTYREMRTHEDLELDFERKIMWYTPKINLVFAPELSVGQPELMNATMPNVPMLGVLSKISSFPYFTRVAMNILVNQVNSKPIVTMDASTYMWGYQEPIVSMAHTLVPGFINFDKMGLLDRIYDPKNVNRLELSIDDKDKFRIRKRNGHKKLKMSDSVDPDTCEKCSTFENTYEGLGYPNGLTPEFPIRVFRNGLCKILELEYNGTKNMNFGGEGMVYHFNDSFFSETLNETNDGILDLSDCFYSLPLAVTKAHFLDMDPRIYERIEGMNPSEELHRSWATIEPITGLEVETSVKLQLNLKVGDMSFNSKASRFSNMVIPILNLKFIQPELPKDTADILKSLYSIGPLVLIAAKCLFSSLALASWAYFVWLLYLNSKDFVMKISVQTMSEKKFSNAQSVEQPLMEKI